MENLTGTVTNNPVSEPQDFEAEATPSAKKSKKMLWLVGLVVVLTGLAVGVYMFRDQLGVNSNGPVTLTYWGLWEPPQVMQPLIDGYKKLHPNVTIKYEQRPIENHYQTVKSRLSRSGSDVPDIVRVHSSWVPVLQKELAPLPASVMSNEEFGRTFYPVTKSDLLIGGSYYAMPLEIDGLALVYNQDLFRQAGISRPPQTWDELRQDATRLTVKNADSKIVVAGIAMGETDNVDNFADIVGLLMAQNGVQFTNAKGEVVFDQAITGDGRNLAAEAMSFYRLFSTVEGDWDNSLEASSVAFSKGKVAMILATSQQLASIVTQNPQLNYAVAPVPQLASNQHVGYASYWVEAVAKNSPHAMEAWQFLAYLSGKEQEMALADQEAKIQPFAEPYSRVDLAETLANDPVLATYVGQAPTYRTSFFTNMAQAPELNGAIDDSLAKQLAAMSGGGAGENNKGGELVSGLATSVREILAGQEK